MKSVIGRWAAVVFMSCLIVACSSIRARSETGADEWTVYPGIRRDVKETGDLLNGRRSEADWVKGLIATILIADLPFSAVFDTLAAPYDLYRVHAPEHAGEPEPRQDNLQRDKK